MVRNITVKNTKITLERPLIVSRYNVDTNNE